APFQSLRIEIRLLRWIVRNGSDTSGVPNPLAFRRDCAFRGIVRAVLGSDRDLVQACTNQFDPVQPAPVAVEGMMVLTCEGQHGVHSRIGSIFDSVSFRGV